MSTWSWCFGRSSYSYRSPFHWVSQFFDKLNLRSWSVPATPFVRAQWSSWRLTPGTVVQWRCDTSTHRHGVTWVMHRSHRCRCLDVPLFERGYGKECFFAVHLQVLPTGDVFIVRRLRIQLTLRRMQLLTRNPTVASLIFDASLHVCTEWVIASTASEVMMLF